jgi:predicted RNA-binding Zn-ribbon protein involved in translation (DUF1610 family)
MDPIVQRQEEFPCPDCGAKVTVDFAQESTAGQDLMETGQAVYAKCPQCGRAFSEGEVDDILSGDVTE